MKVLIISGFLGAGKTTFIRHLTENSERNFAVLENEFGQTDIDAKLIGENKDLSVFEVSENCVCCTGKTDFLNSLLTISNSLDPDYLIVEPTGIAKLGNILTNVKSLHYDRISMLSPVVIVDAGSFFEEKETYDDIYLNQIRNAGTIVLSKSETYSEEDLKPYRKALRELNPEAELVCGDYTAKEKEWWEALLQKGDSEAVSRKESEEETIAFPVKGRQQQMETYSLHGVKLPTPVHLMMILDLVTGDLFGKIPRAKGYLPCGNEWIRFDLVDRRWSITGFSPLPGSGEPDQGQLQPSDAVCTFIGSDIAREDLNRYFYIFEEEKKSFSEGEKQKQNTSGRTSGRTSPFRKYIRKAVGS